MKKILIIILTLFIITACSNEDKILKGQVVYKYEMGHSKFIKVKNLQNGIIYNVNIIDYDFNFVNLGDTVLINSEWNCRYYIKKL